MAKKKGKTESVLSRETRLKAEVDAILRSKAAAEKAVADKAAEAERIAAAKRPPAPIPKAARPKKVKRARFVREQTEKKPEPKAAPLAERSTKADGKLMTRNVTYRPKDEPGIGQAHVTVLEGMGHDFPVPLLPKVAEEIVAHCCANP